MPRSGSGPMTMTFPPFAGVTRKLVFANVATFFGLLILGWLSTAVEGTLRYHLILHPLAVAHGEIWQLATYSFIQTGILDILFGMLTLWFLGSMLEGSFGSLWLLELYATSAIGGALLATLIAFTGIFHLTPGVVGSGAWAGIFGILIAIAMRFGDQEFRLYFVINIRAKYMVAIYILIAVAMLLKEANTFGALLELAGAFAGFLYVRYAPRRGLAFGVTEQYFGLRNAYYRNKRRQAAKKFEVYMGKQGREVHFDQDGRYVDPDGKKDPTDKRWMN